jgi:hypothetical protein
MQSVTNAISITVILTALALGACRKEVAHQPMKLGAELPVIGQANR